jgi:hypothetical protein
MVAAWAAGEHALTRTTFTQLRDGTATSEALLSPGDLVLTPGADGALASPGHVAMFIGHGLVVEAPHAGDVVKVVTYASLTSRGFQLYGTSPERWAIDVQHRLRPFFRNQRCSRPRSSRSPGMPLTEGSWPSGLATRKQEPVAKPAGPHTGLPPLVEH